MEDSDSPSIETHSRSVPSFADFQVRDKARPNWRKTAEYYERDLIRNSVEEEERCLREYEALLRTLKPAKLRMHYRWLDFCLQHFGVNKTRRIRQNKRRNLAGKGLHDYAEHQAMKRFKPDGYRWIELLLRKVEPSYLPNKHGQGYRLSEKTVEMMQRLRSELNIPRTPAPRARESSRAEKRKSRRAADGDRPIETINLNDDGFLYSYSGFRFFNEFVRAQREPRIHMLRSIGFNVCYDFDIKTCRERLMVTLAKRLERSASFPVTETLIANPAKVRADFAAEYDISIADAKALFASASLGGVVDRKGAVWKVMESGYNDYLRQRLEQDDTLRSLREECKRRQEIFQRKGAYSVLKAELDFVDGRFYKNGDRKTPLDQRQLYTYLYLHEELEAMNVIRARMKHLGIRALYVHDGFYTQQLIRRTPEELASDREMEVVIQAGYPIGIKIKELRDSQCDLPINHTNTSTISYSLVNTEAINRIEKPSEYSAVTMSDDSCSKPPEPASSRPNHLSDMAISLGSRAEWEENARRYQAKMLRQRHGQ